MATFSVRFLGCDDSRAVAEEVRARPVAEGHEERRGGVAATCSVTRDTGAKPALERARREHLRSVSAKASRGRVGELGEERVPRVTG